MDCQIQSMHSSWFQPPHCPIVHRTRKSMKIIHTSILFVWGLHVNTRPADSCCSSYFHAAGKWAATTLWSRPHLYWLQRGGSWSLLFVRQPSLQNDDFRNIHLEPTSWYFLVNIGRSGIPAKLFQNQFWNIWILALLKPDNTLDESLHKITRYFQLSFFINKAWSRFIRNISSADRGELLC